VRTILGIGTLIVAAQAAVALLGIVTLRAYTEFAPAAVFGASSLIVNALTLGQTVFVAGFTAVQLRYYSMAEAEGFGDGLSRDAMKLSLAATTLLAVLAIAVWAALRAAGTFAYGWNIVGGGIAWLFAMTLRNVLMSRIQARRRQVTYASLQIVEAVLLLAATVIALRFSATVESYLLGQSVAVAVFVVIIAMLDTGAVAILRLQPWEWSPFPRDRWRYGLPFVPLSFLSWLANLADRYILAGLMSVESAGRYVAPSSISSRALLLMNTSLCDLFRPHLFEASNRAGVHEARRILGLWLMCSAAVSGTALAAVYFGGDLIVRLMLAPAYRDGAATIMLWIVGAYAISGITQILETYILSLGFSGRLLGPMTVGALAKIGFSVVWIRSQGILGAAEATCASFAVQSLITLIVLNRTPRRGDPAALKETDFDVA
jgi:O-antigen/teichoic acid export membrane protein